MDKKVLNNTNNNWSNDSNQQTFYDHVSGYKTLSEYATQTGLHNGCDIKLIFQHITSSQKLLEVGGGYGRVVSKLLNMNFKGEISIIERSKIFSDILANQFSPNVNIFNVDLMNFNTSIKFDAVLSMWCGISDFPPEYQFQYMQKLYDYCSDGGTIIMDTALSNVKPPHAEVLDNQNYVINNNGSIVKGYIPSVNEINSYAGNLKLATIDQFVYETDSGRKRNMHIFKKR